MKNNFLTKLPRTTRAISNIFVSSYVGLIGVLCSLGLFNPINIPDKSEVIVVKGMVDYLKTERLYVSINLKTVNKYELKYLKSSGDYDYLMGKISRNSEFTFRCFNSKIHFNIHDYQRHCYVFEVMDGDGYIVKMDEAIKNTSKINFYVLMVGLFFVLYSLVNLFLLLSRKDIANKFAAKFGLR